VISKSQAVDVSAAIRFARLADGSGLVVDVRADDRIEAKDAEAFAATERACAEVGWAFRRVGTVAPVFGANVRWLAGYRHPRCYRSQVAVGLLEVLASFVVDVSTPSITREVTRSGGPAPSSAGSTAQFAAAQAS
jgi:hypothetical protein